MSTHLVEIDLRKWWNVDGLGYMRGKYLTPVQALRLGAKAIRNCFRDQLEAMKQEGIDNMGIAGLLLYIKKKARHHV